MDKYSHGEIQDALIIRDMLCDYRDRYIQYSKRYIHQKLDLISHCVLNVN